MKFITIPGLHGSGEEHWQSKWEEQHPDLFHRVEQKNWSKPVAHQWIKQIEDSIGHLDLTDVILIGHSIGCIAIVKWLEEYEHVVKGVFLVAPSDADAPDYPLYIQGFSPISTGKIKCKSIVVASNNDHVTPIARSKEMALNWGAKLIVLENAGHVEPQSGFTDWKEGLNQIMNFDLLSGTLFGIIGDNKPMIFDFKCKLK